GLRFLMFVPVERTARVARNPQVAGVARRELVPLVVDDPRAVAGHDRAARAATRAARPVADEDVKHFRRADAVDDLGSEALLPALEERFREGLACRDAEPQRGEVVSEVLLRIRQ